MKLKVVIKFIPLLILPLIITLLSSQPVHAELPESYLDSYAQNNIMFYDPCLGGDNSSNNSSYNGGTDNGMRYVSSKNGHGHWDGESCTNISGSLEERIKKFLPTIQTVASNNGLAWELLAAQFIQESGAGQNEICPYNPLGLKGQGTAGTCKGHAQFNSYEDAFEHYVNHIIPIRKVKNMFPSDPYSAIEYIEYGDLAYAGDSQYVARVSAHICGLQKWAEKNNIETSAVTYANWADGTFTDDPNKASSSSSSSSSNTKSSSTNSESSNSQSSQSKSKTNSSDDSSSDSDSSDTEGDSIAEIMWNYFVDLNIEGFSDNPSAIAGILGNSYAESGLTNLNLKCQLFGLKYPEYNSTGFNEDYSEYLNKNGSSSKEAKKDLTIMILDNLTADINKESRYYGKGKAYAQNMKTFVNDVKEGTKQVSNTSGEDGAISYADLYMRDFENAFCTSNSEASCERMSDAKVNSSKTWQHMEKREEHAVKNYNKFQGNTGTTSSPSSNLCTESEEENQCSGDGSSSGGDAIAKEAAKLAWPFRGDDDGGTDGYCDPGDGKLVKYRFSGTSYTSSNCRTNPKPAYKKAYTQIQGSAGNNTCNGGDVCDCGKFVGTVVRSSGIDPKFPKAGSQNMRSYMEKSSDWKKVNLDNLQPGDILVNSHHIKIYIGDYGGDYGDYAQASSGTTVGVVHDSTNKEKESAFRYIGKNTGSSSSSCPTASTCQFNSLNAEGCKLYCQGDGESWSQSTYIGGTFSSTGCGPSSLAMIIANLSGDKSVTPVTIANLIKEKYRDNAFIGDSIRHVAEQYGIKSEDIGVNFTIEDVNNVLDKGGVVWVSGTGTRPWSEKNGHFFAIRGKTSDGKWLLFQSAYGCSSPGYTVSKTAWDPKEIMARKKTVNSGHYAFYKE